LVRGKRFGLMLLSMPALVFLTLPLLGLLVKADVVRFGAYVCCDEVKSALSLSLITATVSALISLLIGTPLAYWLAYGRFRGKRIVDTLVDLPVVLPPTVAGLALFMALGRQGLLGPRLEAFGISLPFTTAAVVLAQTFVSCPFFIRQARVGFQSVPPHLVLASRTLGASASRTFWRVTLPLAWHALVAGLIMAWSRAIGEFGATLIFAGNMEGTTRTMPLAIYAQFIGEGKVDSSVVLALTLVAVSFLVMIVTKMLLAQETRSAESQAIALV
jgi:molybdate transport system permease protein